MSKRTAVAARKAASESLGLRPGLDVDVFYGSDAPGVFAQRLDQTAVRMMSLEVQCSEAAFQEKHGRRMKPSERLFLHQEILYRSRYGVAPRDAMAGRILGMGPMAGHLIEGGSFRLNPRGDSAHPVKLLSPHEAKISEDIFTLGTAADTKAGGSATDMAPVTSPWDNGLHGQASGVVPAPQLNEMLKVYSRGMSFLPLAFIGFAPDLTFEQRIRTNSIVSQLFEGTNLSALKAAILPRKEGTSGAAELRPTYGKTQYTCRGYMFHSSLTLEVLTSMAGGILGIENDAVMDLYAAPGYVGEYDIFQAIITGFKTGYTRRYKATTAAWDISTNEVPFGKAEFITTEAKRHWVWFDLLGGGKFYAPKGTADFFKFQSSDQADTSSIWDPAGGYKVFDCLTYLANLQRKKGKRMDAAWMSVDCLTLLTQDERSQNNLFTVGDKLPLTGEAGYAGNIQLPGSSTRLDIYTYDEGGIPAVTDGNSLAMDHIILAGEYGSAVTYSPFWPFTLLMDAEYVTATVDSLSRTRRSLNDVLTAFSMECVEPKDLRAVSMALIPSVAHS